MNELWNKIKLYSKNTIVRSITFIIIIGLILSLVSTFLSTYFGQMINSWSPYIGSHLHIFIIVYFLYGVLQAFIPPLPSMPADVLMFALIGYKLVFIIALVSTLCGYSLSFLVADKYGKRVLKRLLSEETYDNVILLSHRMNWKHFFSISIIPINQPDIMAYVAGISKLKYRQMISALAIVIAVRMLFTLFFLEKFWVR